MAIFPHLCPTELTLTPPSFHLTNPLSSAQLVAANTIARPKYLLVLSLWLFLRALCVGSFLLAPTSLFRRPVLASTLMASVAAAARNSSTAAPPRTPRTSPPRRVLRLALAGDTMLGRCVAEAILQARDPPDAPKDTERTKMPFPPAGCTLGTPPRKPKANEAAVFAPELVALAHEADLFFLNLECCITNHQQRWPNPHKPFFFRAPFCAVEELKVLGVDAVTLANNHALDYDVTGLEDTLETLDEAGIPYTGAGRNLAEARQPVILEHEGMRIGIIGVTDHPLEFDAKADRPGVCYVDLQRRSDVDTPAVAGGGGGGGMGPLVPTWLGDKIRFLKEVEHCDVVMVSPHWGPNMCLDPLLYVREAANILHDMGADLIAGHSAHCFQGASAELRCLYDMGDFVDDYATDPYARNDLGLFFFMLFDLDTKQPWRVEAVPLKLDFCLTRLATGQDYDFIVQRFKKFSAKFGTRVWEDKQRQRLVFDL